MTIATREQLLSEVLKDQPAFRIRQCEEAVFQVANTSWDDVTSLPATTREVLKTHVPWITVQEKIMQQSAKLDTFKALLTLSDETEIESVLMKNARGAWTICVSSQVGCAMRCGFCATGKMGLTRSLTRDEIVDQYRFWQKFLKEHPELPPRISNVVFMGMGEPLANYTEVRAAINTWLAQTDLGRTRITVSTVGVLPRLEQILTDPEWPHVRLAVSLHSAVQETRKSIVPTSFDDFLPRIADWSKRYLDIHGNRRHHLTFEYVMLRGVNDSKEDARALHKFVTRIGNVRVNLIPYNFTGGEFFATTDERLKIFFDELGAHGVTVTVRKTMGDDIAAACGQLSVVASV